MENLLTRVNLYNSLYGNVYTYMRLQSTTKYTYAHIDVHTSINLSVSLELFEIKIPGKIKQIGGNPQRILKIGRFHHSIFTLNIRTIMFLCPAFRNHS